MAKLILSSIAFAIFISTTLAVVPSYIKVCGRRDPQLNKCVSDTMLGLRPMLAKGIPELDVPPMELLEIGEVALADIKDFRAIATDVKLRGLSNFLINHMNVDVDNQSVVIDLQFPEVHLDSDYDVKAKIIVPVNEKGPIHFISKNVLAKVSLKYKTVTRRGSELMYFSVMKMKLVISDYEATFRPGANDNAITQAINSVLVDSRKEIIESMTPNLEKTISVKVLDIANRMCKHFTYDELLPDRT